MIKKWTLAVILALAFTGNSVAQVALNVLFPPANNSDVAKYLMPSLLVSGVDLVINWSDITSDGKTFNFKIPDAAAAPWIAAHKTVNFVVWANSNSAGGTVGNASVPAYIWNAMGSTNYVNCVTQAGTQRLPNYLSPVWIKGYQAAMAAIASHYKGKVGYIRFGLGHGGETIPGAGWNSPTTACGLAYKKWGVTIATWEGYLKTMLDYEVTLPDVQKMVGITPLGSPSIQVPDYIASIAAPQGIGFGSQGLEASDLKGCATSTADWCELFAKYKSTHVPLELQTIGPSCAADKGCTGNQALTGPLSPLLAYGVAHGATIMEIYWQDWCTALCPDSGTRQYANQYLAALKAAAGSR